MTVKNNRTPRRVLVINDTEEILELFHEIIEGLGHEMQGRTYAPDDLQQVIDAKPDLLIIDIVLAGREMMGWQLLQKLRMKRETAKLPVIVCTAARIEVQEQEGWLTEKGVVTVYKPFEVDDLERAITRALDVADLRPG